MINKLTSSQEKLLQVYREKWLAIGLSTKRIDRKKAKENFMIFNKLILGNKKQPLIIFMDSPLTAWLATLSMYNYFNNQNKNQVRNRVENQVREQVWNRVEEQVWNRVWNRVREQVWNRVREQVRNQLNEQVENQVWNRVEEQVENQVREQVENQVLDRVREQVRGQVLDRVENFIYPYLGGQFDSAYFSFYDFCNKVLKINFQCQEKWNCYLRTSDVGLIYPFKEFCVISEKPTEIKMKNGVLHNESGAAIQYADDFSIYCLNGIKVSKEIVETPAEKLDPYLIVKEKNVEIRREIVRKIGIERICQKLNAKCIEKKDEYELLLLDLGDNRKRPYLKMRNPSIGTYHIEGVPPQIKTLEEALNFHFRGFNKGELLFKA